MDKLFEIKKIQPVNTQLLIRTDIKTGNWFIHFYTKKIYESGELVKDETIFKDYCNDIEIEKVLDKIIEWCITNK